METERLFLREFTIEDAENLYLLNSDPEVIRYTGNLPFVDLNQANFFLKNYSHYKEYGYGRWAVINKIDFSFLGWCGLKYDSKLDEIDIGYRFFKKYWNMGYATESARFCIEFGFLVLDMKTIIGRAMIENKASIKVLKKIGLKYLKEDLCGINPGVIYSITKKEFLKKNN